MTTRLDKAGKDKWSNKPNKSTDTEAVGNLLQENQELFKDELGHCKGIKAKLQIKANSSPKFHRPRPIALGLKEKVEADLERQEKLSILEKVETAQWAAPIVPVPKPNGFLT